MPYETQIQAQISRKKKKHEQQTHNLLKNGVTH